jgi:hypothetical protein
VGIQAPTKPRSTDGLVEDGLIGLAG